MSKHRSCCCQHDQDHDELRIAELHSPARLMAGGLHSDDEARQQNEGKQDTQGVNQAEPANMLRTLGRLADEPQDFQRDDR